MAEYDLTTDDGLRAACEHVGPPERWAPGGGTWNRKLSETLKWVRDATRDVRATREFQERLWEDNHVAAVGQGTVSVERALDDAGFRGWLAERSLAKLPDPSQDRLAFLTAFYEEVKEQLEPFLDGKVPHLKIFRVMAALFPDAMTTLASSGALHKLAKAMGSTRKLEPVERHVWVRERIDRVFSSPPANDSALAERMSIPWILYERFVLIPSETTQKNEGPDDSKLLPLPAARRRRGLTPIRGLFTGVLSVLEYVKDGPTRIELLDYLRASSPESKANSLGVTINVLQGELAVIRAQGDRYILTERGEDVLESQDPGHLADWILTRILGADTALFQLRERGPQTAADLLGAIRSTNPGWTSDYVPQSIVSWLRSMGVVERRPDGQYDLTAEGRSWAERIHWTPESLAAEPEAITPAGSELPAEGDSKKATRPDLTTILERVREDGHFQPAVVARLHAGLWSHERRHFAVLTGLSGSGKTLLARAYARALSGSDGAARALTLAVQPGWYDPGPLLGYVNPLRVDSYVRTRFSDFLIAAAANPEAPYTAILDEMNLSHPEQYLAPILSAMETGEPIQLHAEGDYCDGVPRAVSYPKNLVLIGTVNMDETTHGLSDKVLDRAFVLEFWDIDLDAYPRWGKRSILPESEKRARELLSALMLALAPARLHFGWRVVDDVLSFLEEAQATGESLAGELALDAVVTAKLLPKLRGDDSPRFRVAFSACEEALKRFGLAASADRVAELRQDLETTGSARFWR